MQTDTQSFETETRVALRSTTVSGKTSSGTTDIKRTAILVSLVFATCAIATASPLSGPEVVDVGHLALNTLKKFEFKVKNDSEVHVTIGEIKTSCSCTNVKLEGSESLVPGAERAISGNVNLGSKIGHYETRVLIAFKSKGGKAEQKVVHIRGKVVTAIVLEKNRVDFGSVDIGADPQVVMINATRGNSGDPWDTIKAEAGSDHLWGQVEAAGNKMRIKVQFAPTGLPISAFHGSVKLRLFDHGKPLAEAFELPVTAQVTGPITATPRSVYLGAIPLGRSISRPIAIRSPTLDLRELKFEEHSTEIQASLQWSDNKAATVIVKFTPNERKAPSSIVENITLVHASSGSRITIPFVGIVKTP